MKSLEVAPAEWVTEDLCWIAIRQNGMALAHVPLRMKTPEMCLEAILHDGFLGDVPEAMRSPDICRAAVRQDGLMLQFVPESLRDREVCDEAVRSGGDALSHVPETIRNYEMCMTAVTQDGRTLRHVPRQFRDREMCEAAVRSCRWAMRYVPSELRDLDMGLASMRGEFPDVDHLPMTWRQPVIDRCTAEGISLPEVLFLNAEGPDWNAEILGGLDHYPETAVETNAEEEVDISPA